MIIEVRVKPGSKRERVVPETGPGGGRSLLVELKALPQDGKANAALIAVLARHFGLPRAAITIKRGATSRHKIIEVTTPDQAAL